jgi:RNA polymerase sigma-70 factor (ECF subfamily)
MKLINTQTQRPSPLPKRETAVKPVHLGEKT